MLRDQVLDVFLGKMKYACSKSKRVALKAVRCMYSLQFSIVRSFPKWMILSDKCVDGGRIQSGYVHRSKITVSKIVPHLEITCAPATMEQKFSRRKLDLQIDTVQTSRYPQKNILGRYLSKLCTRWKSLTLRQAGSQALKTRHSEHEADVK